MPGGGLLADERTVKPLIFLKAFLGPGSLDGAESAQTRLFYRYHPFSRRITARHPALPSWGIESAWKTLDPACRRTRQSEEGSLRSVIGGEAGCWGREINK